MGTHAWILCHNKREGCPYFDLIRDVQYIVIYINLIHCICRY